MDITVFTQSAILLSGKENIYFDPFKITKEFHNADYIFITHDHYDHYDETSIQNVMKKSTFFIVPKILEEKIKKMTSQYIVVDANQHYKVGAIEFDCLPAYNKNKPYHPKEKGYVGYNVSVDGKKYYVMGDTDALEELEHVKTDICFIPIGGVYTMDVFEAIGYINTLNPKKVIPIHYGSIVGDVSLGTIFKKGIKKEIEVELKLEEEK